MFVLCATNHRGIYYSTDGFNWTDSPTTGWYRTICYGNGKFVAVGGPYTAYSLDGINWVETEDSTSPDWQDVCYGDGEGFIAVAHEKVNYAYRYKYSTNGTSWTEQSEYGISYGFDNVCYGDGYFFMTGVFGVIYRQGINGMSLTLTQFANESYNWRPAFGNHRVAFVIATGAKAKYIDTGLELSSQICSKAYLKSLVASCSDWAAFKTKIAAL